MSGLEDLQRLGVEHGVRGIWHGDRLVELLHGWIRDGLLDGLWVDVVDYRHVPSGPDLILVGVEGNVCLTRRDDSTAVHYWRKRPTPGSFSERLKGALCLSRRAATAIAKALDGEAELETARVIANDRLHGQVAQELASAVGGALRSVHPQIVTRAASSAPGERPSVWVSGLARG